MGTPTIETFKKKSNKKKNKKSLDKKELPVESNGPAINGFLESNESREEHHHKGNKRKRKDGDNSHSKSSKKVKTSSTEVIVHGKIKDSNSSEDSESYSNMKAASNSSGLNIDDLISVGDGSDSDSEMENAFGRKRETVMKFDSGDLELDGEKFADELFKRKGENSGIGTKAKQLKDEKSEEELDEEKILAAIREEGNFKNFNLSEDTINNLKADGVNYLFQIQVKTFKFVYDGLDVIAKARTGTGKTLAFALPLIERLNARPRIVGSAPAVLILLPTRELAIQVSECFMKIARKLRCHCVYGGTAYGPQLSALRRGLDILIGTPGRTKDLVEKQALDLTKLEFVVLDEVDRMLDMGFSHDVEELIENSYNREAEANPQTLLFSATVPQWVMNVANKYMDKSYKLVDLVGKEGIQTATTVKHLAIRCLRQERPAVICDLLFYYADKSGKAIVFCETKKGASDLSQNESFKLTSQVLHGDIQQKQRETVLSGFKNGHFQVLVTTDVSARGLDIPNVDVVIQCTPPNDVDSYIHRSGRTGRAGKNGISICFYAPGDDMEIRNVERKAQIKFKRVGPPQSHDLCEKRLAQFETSMDDIPKDTLKMISEQVQYLIDEKGANEVAVAAMTKVLCCDKFICRSLLTCSPGKVTYKVQTTQEIFNVAAVFALLKTKLSAEVVGALTSIQLGRDKTSAVFEVNSNKEKKLLKQWKDDDDMQLIILKEFPDIIDNSRGRDDPGRRRFGGRGFGGGRGRGYGRGGGRGYGGGYGGRGGGGRGRGFGGRGGGGGGFGGGRGGGGFGGRGRSSFQKTGSRFGEAGSGKKTIF